MAPARGQVRERKRAGVGTALLARGAACAAACDGYVFAFARRWRVKIKVVVHEAEEGGFWAEVPAIPGCATQGETFEELLGNLYEAVEGCLSVDVAEPKAGGKERVFEIAV